MKLERGVGAILQHYIFLARSRHQEISLPHQQHLNTNVHTKYTTKMALRLLCKNVNASLLSRAPVVARSAALPAVFAGTCMVRLRVGHAHHDVLFVI